MELGSVGVRGNDDDDDDDENPRTRTRQDGTDERANETRRVR